MLFNGLFIRFFLFDLKQPKDFTVLSTLFSPGVRHMFQRKKTWADTVNLTHGLSFVNVTWTPEIGLQLECFYLYMCLQAVNEHLPGECGQKSTVAGNVVRFKSTWQEMNWTLNLLLVSKVDSTTLEHCTFLSRSSKSKETLASNSRETHVETHNKKMCFCSLSE